MLDRLDFLNGAKGWSSWPRVRKTLVRSSSPTRPAATLRRKRRTIDLAAFIGPRATEGLGGLTTLYPRSRPALPSGFRLRPRSGFPRTTVSWLHGSTTQRQCKGSPGTGPLSRTPAPGCTIVSAGDWLVMRCQFPSPSGLARGSRGRDPSRRPSLEGCIHPRLGRPPRGVPRELGSSSIDRPGPYPPVGAGWRPATVPTAGGSSIALDCRREPPAASSAASSGARCGEVATRGSQGLSSDSSKRSTARRLEVRGGERDEHRVFVQRGERPHESEPISRYETRALFAVRTA